jgi:hypothetical protein
MCKTSNYEMPKLPCPVFMHVEIFLSGCNKQNLTILSNDVQKILRLLQQTSKEHLKTIIL